MNNKPATQVAVIAAFIQIAIQLVFVYIGTEAFGMNVYLRYLLTGFSMLMYLLVLVFLLSVLKFFNEKNSIITAFGVYIAFTAVYNILSLNVNTLGFNIVTYYSIISSIHFLMVLYVVIMSFMVKHPVIRKAFALFAILSLITAVTVMALPVLFGFLQIGFQAYRYIYVVNVLPLIAAIIIFIKTDEGTKSIDFTGEKPLFKDDPF